LAKAVLFSALDRIIEVFEHREVFAVVIHERDNPASVEPH
jgi:hypothetical protein